MKVSVYIATSLDGFIAREDGALDWLPGSDGQGAGGEDFGYAAFMESVDVLVMGRHTYEKVRSFGAWSYGSKRVIVLSGKLQRIADDLPKTVELRACSPAALLRDLRESGVKHVYVDGGKTIQGFLNAGLIRDIIITCVPVLIGSGIPLFGPLNADLKLEHIETRAFANGFVQSHYAVCAGHAETEAARDDQC